MKIKKLTLYNTKLDANYFNVIDGGFETTLTKETYKENVLDAYYTPFVIYNGAIKAGHENNGVLTIKITQDYTTMLNYNYVCVDDGNQLYFYFITNINGLNDTQTPITELTLTRDAWGNNIEYLTNQQQDDIQQIVRSHYARWYDDGNGRTFWPFYYNSADGANITKFKKEQFLYTTSGNYVVWCWFRLSNDCKLGPPENAVPVKNAYFGKSYFDAAAPVYVFPVAVVTGFTDGVPNFNFNITFNGNAINMATAGQLLKAFNFNSDKFLEAGLTLYPPFAYNCSGTTITASGVISTTASIVNELDEVIYNPDDEFAQVCYVVVCNTSTAYTTLNYEYTNELTAITPTGSVGTVLFDPQATYNDVKLYDPRVYCKPFVDLQFICNNLSVPIEIIQDRTKFKAIVNFGGKTNPLVTCFLNDDIISSYNTLAGIGNIPTSVNKWESFLTKTITTVGLSTIGGALGGIGGGAIGVAGGAIGGLMSSGANAVQDIVNTASQPTHTSQPSELAGDNIPRQIPKIVINKWVADKELEGIVGEIYTYGYRYRTTRSVKYNCRVWFDYCQTEECKLPLIPNLQDRETLQNAFNRGLTKWHYDNDFGFNSNFNKYQNNIEREWLNAEDAQISFNFTKSKPWQNYGTFGATLELNNRTGTYELTQNGVKLTRASGAKIASTTTTINGTYIQLAERANSFTCLFKLTDVENVQPDDYLVVLDDKHRFKCGNNGNLWLGPTWNINYYIDTGIPVTDCVNKTVTFSHYYNGYANGSSRIFIDGVQVYEVNNSNTTITIVPNFTPKFGTGTNGGFTISKFKMYVYPGVNYVWTEDEAKKHLL